MTSAPQLPGWARPMLRSLLVPARRDDVIGDLVETVRENRSLWNGLDARIWWARQVLGLFVRTYWGFPLLLIATLVSNDLLNAFRDASGNRLGPDLFLPTVFVVFVCAGLLGGWRTQRTSGGIAASAGSHLLAWTFMNVWWLVTTYPFALRQQHNPYWINAWQGSAAPGESFLHWIAWDNVGAFLLGGSVLMIAAIVLGATGGIAGRLSRPGQPARP
jgi:hypothetical protein